MARPTNRVRQKEMKGLFSLDEELDGGSWPVARTYSIFRGTIWPGEEWRTTTEKPLSRPETFLDFARLAAHGNPSEDSILRWVGQYGLLRRRDPDCANFFTPAGEPNQQPMSLKDFREETRCAYRLLRLFESWRGGDVSALRPRMELRPEGSRFAQVVMDNQPLAHWVPRGESLSDELVLSVTRRVLEAGIEPEISSARIAFGPDHRLVLHYPDLHTAMYGAFAALVGGKQAAGLCEVCGRVYVKRRRDHLICSATCRSVKSRARKNAVETSPIPPPQLQ